MMRLVANHPLFPNVRRSPYFDRTEAAGADASWPTTTCTCRWPTAATADEYSALTDGVTLWDVGAERQVGSGPDAWRSPTTWRRATCRAPSRALPVTLIGDEDGIVICDPVVLRVDDRVWLSHGNVDLLLWAGRRARTGST